MDEILNLIESVSEEFPSYSYDGILCVLNLTKRYFLGFFLFFFMRDFITKRLQ